MDIFGLWRGWRHVWHVTCIGHRGPRREELTFHDGAHGPLEGQMSGRRCVDREGVARASQVTQVVTEGANTPKCVGPLDYRVQRRWEGDCIAPISCFHELQPVPDPCRAKKQRYARAGLSQTAYLITSSCAIWGKTPVWQRWLLAGAIWPCHPHRPGWFL